MLNKQHRFLAYKVILQKKKKKKEIKPVAQLFTDFNMRIEVWD